MNHTCVRSLVTGMAVLLLSVAGEGIDSDDRGSGGAAGGGPDGGSQVPGA